MLSEYSCCQCHESCVVSLCRWLNAISAAADAVKKQPLQISDDSNPTIAPPVDDEFIAHSPSALSDSMSALDQIDQYVIMSFFHSSLPPFFCRTC